MKRSDYLKQIESRIAAAPNGTAFVASDFLDIADSDAVRKALSRLAESGKIRRIIRGVYDCPRFSRLLQEFEAPNIEETAKAIARNFGWHIAPCGDTALNLLGLSTQIPAVWQYVSDGPYRDYSIGNIQLKFKHTSSTDLSGHSYETALLTQALKALGKQNIDSHVIQKLRTHYQTTEGLPDILLESQHGTTWILEVKKSILAGGEKE